MVNSIDKSGTVQHAIFTPTEARTEGKLKEDALKRISMGIRDNAEGKVGKGVGRFTTAGAVGGTAGVLGTLVGSSVAASKGSAIAATIKGALGGAITKVAGAGALGKLGGLALFLKGVAIIGILANPYVAAPVLGIVALYFIYKALKGLKQARAGIKESTLVDSKQLSGLIADKGKTLEKKKTELKAKQQQIVSESMKIVADARAAGYKGKGKEMQKFLTNRDHLTDEHLFGKGVKGDANHLGNFVSGGVKNRILSFQQEQIDLREELETLSKEIEELNYLKENSNDPEIQKKLKDTKSGAFGVGLGIVAGATMGGMHDIASTLMDMGESALKVVKEMTYGK